MEHESSGLRPGRGGFVGRGRFLDEAQREPVALADGRVFRAIFVAQSESGGNVQTPSG